MKFKLLVGPSVGNVFVVSNWYKMELRRERRREKRRERQRHELMTSWLLEYNTSKRTRGYALTFGCTEGSMLVRREWFDAMSKGMVRC